MSISLATFEQKALDDHNQPKVHKTTLLVQKLAALAKFIGCREPVPPDMMDAVIKRIITKYKQFSYQDITNAFHYYLDNMEGAKKIYDLNGLTISLILNPYWGYLHRIKAKKTDIERVNKVDEITTVSVMQNKETEKEAFDFIDCYCKNHDTLPLGASWTWAYDHASKNGIIERDEGDLSLRESMTRERINGESANSTDPKSYRNKNLTSEGVDRRMKEDMIQEYMMKEHGVTKHKFSMHG